MTVVAETNSNTASPTQKFSRPTWPWSWTFLPDNRGWQFHGCERIFFTKFQASMIFCSGLTDMNVTNTQTSSSILWFPWGGSHNNLNCVINRVGSITFKMYFNYKIQITFLKSNSNIFSITLALAKYKIHFLKVIKIQNNKVSVIAVRQRGICLTSVCSVHRA